MNFEFKEIDVNNVNEICNTAINSIVKKYNLDEVDANFIFRIYNNYINLLESFQNLIKSRLEKLK